MRMETNTRVPGRMAPFLAPMSNSFLPMVIVLLETLSEASSRETANSSCAAREPTKAIFLQANSQAKVGSITWTHRGTKAAGKTPKCTAKESTRILREKKYMKVASKMGKCTA